jgi:phage gp45-like
VTDSTFGDVIKRQSPTTLLGAAALVLVVGLAAGFGIGYKVEQSRTRADVKKTEKNAAAKVAKSKTAAVGTTVRVIGKVDATAAKTVSVTVKDKTSRKLALQAGTLFVKAVPGSAADITKGSRVIVRAKSGSLTLAEEIIVLPANARLGSLLTDVASGSMTYKAKGKDIKIVSTGATIEKVENATKTDVANGSTILAQTRQTKGGLTATEIIVLPAGTKFA